MDMVAIRQQTLGGDQRTTVILIMVTALDVIDNCYTIMTNDDKKQSLHGEAVDLATKFITMLSLVKVKHHVKDLLMTLLSNKRLSTGTTSSDPTKHKIIIFDIFKVFWLVMLTALEMEKREGSILPMDLDVEEPSLACNDPEVSLANVKLSSLKMDSCYMTTIEIVKLTGSHIILKLGFTLPVKEKLDEILILSEDERDIYDELLLCLHGLFPDQANMAKVLELLLCMQQCFCHLSLLNLEAETPDDSLDDHINQSNIEEETRNIPGLEKSFPSTKVKALMEKLSVFAKWKMVKEKSWPSLCCFIINFYIIVLVLLYLSGRLTWRAINYDEKEPFLCNTCGFCKYAQFDYTLLAKSCCAVDPIENEEDRKKSSNVNQYFIRKS
ncbi:hypothetical protein CHUAL_001656 [Chamberlinius hualienensis]